VINVIRNPLLLSFFAVLLLLVVGRANAELNASVFCEHLSSITKSAMNASHSGNEMSKLIRKIDDVIADNPSDKVMISMSESTKDYIVKVYGYPLVHDQGMKEEVALQFGNSIYLGCYKYLDESYRQCFLDDGLIHAFTRLEVGERVSAMRGYVRFVFAMSVLASLTGAAQADDSIHEVCEAHSTLAKSIMRSRQFGLEMSQMMKTSESSEDITISKLSKLYVIRAFKYPRVHDNGIEKEIVNEFGSAAYSQCFMALEKLMP